MSADYGSIRHALEGDSKHEKVLYLEKCADMGDPEIIRLVISRLDDPDIQVRGEAFGSLVLNENRISGELIKNLNSEKTNVRGFCTLVLANRGDGEGVPEIIKLTADQSPMVRSCALGALGFLKAREASRAIHSCFSDVNLEVRKSALKAAIDLGDDLLPEETKKISVEKDEELEELLILAKQCQSGPEGIS